MLSLRQWQIINLIVQGERNRDIAITLGLSQGTVKEYVSRIMETLHLRNRTELAVWALHHPCV